MGFPFTPRSMTLDGQIILEFCNISRVLEAITGKRMKIDPYRQRQKI